MAKKFFNKRVNSRKKTLISGVVVGICIIGIVLCFYLTQNINKDNDDDVEVIVKLQESVSIDLNSKEPDTEVFFLELSGVSSDDITVDYSNVDFSTLGEYTVTITVLDEKNYVKLIVVDVSSPSLEVASVAIEEGETYSVSDFVIGCTDNSNEECIISFYGGGVDQNGDTIDYSNLTNAGTHDVVIMATDVNGNTIYQTTTLTIGDEETVTPTECSYGSGDYSSAYILAYNVANNGCALSIDSYHSDSIREPIDSIAETEVEKIKTEVDSITGLSSNIIINKSITAILNDEAIGFVGYSLFVEVTSSEGDSIVSYYLTESGTRIYIDNPYELS